MKNCVFCRLRSPHGGGRLVVGGCGSSSVGYSTVTGYNWILQLVKVVFPIAKSLLQIEELCHL